MAGIKSTGLFLAFCSIPITGLGDEKEPSMPPEKFELLLPEFAPCQLNENQSRLNWHVRNEAHHALSTGVVIAAGYGLNKINSTQYPVQKVITLASIIMDWTHSPSWKDFTYRQLAKTPLLAWNWYKGTAFSPWLHTLIQESPLLLMGAWEVWTQSQTYIPQGTKRVHTSENQESLKILFSNNEAPHFTFQFSLHKPENCQFLELEDNTMPYREYLNLLSCTAYQSSINTLEIEPQNNSATEHSLHIKAIRDGGETLSQNIPVTPKLRKNKQSQYKAVWLTDVLAKTPDKNSIGKALSPLTEGALSALIKAIEDDFDQQPPALIEEELTMTVVGGKSMMVTGLGAGAYLLGDHTDTQGLALPEFWLGTGSTISHDQAAEALKNLEERRKPGPEFGVWRLLTAVRSITHRTIFNQTLNWLTYKEDRNFTKGQYTRIDSRNSPTRSEIDTLLEDIRNTKGRKILIAGLDSSGNNHLANSLIGQDTFDTKLRFFGGPIFESFVASNGDRILLPAPALLTGGGEALNNIKTQLISAGVDEVFFTKNLDTDIQGHHDDALTELIQLFPSEKDATDKITLVYYARSTDETLRELETARESYRNDPVNSHSPFSNSSFKTAFYIKNNDQVTSERIKTLRTTLQGNTSQ